MFKLLLTFLWLREKRFCLLRVVIICFWKKCCSSLWISSYFKWSAYQVFTFHVISVINMIKNDLILLACKKIEDIYVGLETNKFDTFVWYDLCPVALSQLVQQKSDQDKGYLLTKQNDKVQTDMRFKEIWEFNFTKTRTYLIMLNMNSWSKKDRSDKKGFFLFLWDTKLQLIKTFFILVKYFFVPRNYKENELDPK